MDTKAYISSGILEQYCLGLIPDVERAEVERHAAEYPDIRNEMNAIADALEAYALANTVLPADSLRSRLVLAAYETESGAGKKYPPLINKDSVADEFVQWVKEQNIPAPGRSFDNLFLYDLPSTVAVTNCMVWARLGLDEEEHDECCEFVVILDGHCDMYMNGKKTHYTKGEIIRIPPFVPHYAVITSKEPMVAIVQRQLLAA